MSVIDEGLELLEEEECLRLLGTASLGRIGLSVGALPAIFPVNYWMVDGGIVFRTGPGLKLRAALDHTIVAFEVDEADPELHHGWSVLVIGVAREVSHPSESDWTWVPPSSWVGGDRHHFVRIEPDTISGRRIAPNILLDGVLKRPRRYGVSYSKPD